MRVDQALLQGVQRSGKPIVVAAVIEQPGLEHEQLRMLRDGCGVKPV